MSDFGGKLIWRFIAPLALACIISAAGSVVTVVKLSVTVDNLTAVVQKTASQQWVTSQINFLKYQIGEAKSDIKANSQRIEKTRKLMRQYHPLTGTLGWPLLPGWPREPTVTAANRYAVKPQQAGL